MRMWMSFGVGVGMLGTLAVGCSSGVLPNADVSAFCQNKATAECQVAMLCGQADPSSCIAARVPVCIADANQATESGTRTYSQPNAAACISAVQTAYAQSTVSFAKLQSVDTTCEEVFPGTVMDQGSCKIDFDCANSEVCSPVEPGSTMTICAAPIPVPEGSPCANVGSVCAAGTYCTGVPAKCQEGGAAAGTTCSPPATVCQTGFYCQINGGAQSGTCIQTAQEGSACTTDINCSTAAPYCDLSVTPKNGTSTEGSCELGESFATGADDCATFGG
jgi:hypothetical protein